MAQKKIIIQATVDTILNTHDDFVTKRKIFIFEGSDVSVSDGYHTIDELYDHRITLFIALCKAVNQVALTHKSLHVKGQDDMRERIEPWRSFFHSDGTSFDGWFILGMGKKPGQQITYHLPIARLEETEFAQTLDRAPEFDGHTPQDVLDRLAAL